MPRMISVIVATILASVLYYPASAQDTLSPEDCLLDYNTISSDFSKTIKILSDIPKILPVGKPTEAVASPYAQGKLTIYPYDSTKEGSGTSIIIITPRMGQKIALQFDQNIGTNAHWLNEKLVWIEVWLGRIYAAQMIYDTDRRTFIYQDGVSFAANNMPECTKK